MSVIHMPPRKAPMAAMTLPPISLRNLSPKQVIAHCPDCPQRFIGSDDAAAVQQLEAHLIEAHPSFQGQPEAV